MTVKDKFINQINRLPWDRKLRTAAEDLIITYDQMRDLLEELAEYLDNRSDADHDGENFVPNREMRFIMNINGLLNE